jgi:RHS repeat-associated protein
MIAIKNNAFGMVMPERSFSNQKYRWGFNGKETDNEVNGAGNSLDFGARIYDSRLGRWLSLDPLATKYPYLSTYHAFGNSPILIADIDGRENIIYLLVLPSSSISLQKGDAQKIASQATTNFQSMGLKTEVRIVDANSFDMSKIDAHDAVAVLGSSKDVVSFVSKNLDSEFGNELSRKWSGTDKHPEMSENTRDGEYTDNIIAIDASGLEGFANRVGITGEEGDKAIKAGALALNHGAGHNSGLNHSDDPIMYDNESAIMKDASGISSQIKKEGYPSTISKGKNADYIASMKSRFGDNRASDNRSSKPTKK